MKRFVILQLSPFIIRSTVAKKINNVSPPRKYLFRFMVFNATFNNISVILWHQFYWWRILLFLYNVLPNVLVRHITHINTILLTLHIYDITSIILLNSLAKNHRKSKNMNNL